MKKDGSIIQSKVTEVNSDNIKYKKFSNPDGPVYTISKAEILAINYENGDKDTFVTEQAPPTASNTTLPLQQPTPDEQRNQELLALYNREYVAKKDLGDVFGKARERHA
ncbi:MAG: hypothetical protein IJV34_04510 [Prevotella sp.]|nr:hypothetical protein [Prevotella sp.]